MQHRLDISSDDPVGEDGSARTTPRTTSTKHLTLCAGLRVALDDLSSLTGGCPAFVLWLRSDKAKEFLDKSVRALLRAQRIRQATNSGYDPAANSIAEGWVGIAKVRAMEIAHNDIEESFRWRCPQ